MAVSLISTGVQFPDNTTQTTQATGFGFKNRIINGAMVIDQRGAGAVNPNPSYVTDRWNAVTYGSATVEQTGTAPTGFTNSLLWTTTSATAPSAGQWAIMNQGIEGFNVADFGWGASGAQAATLSFWVRSNTTGTYSVGIGNATATNDLPGTQTRSYVATYTINAANTWEYKTITVTGDTTGTWNKTNGLGICVSFDCGSGSTYQTSTVNSWQSGAFWRATGSVGINNTSSGTLLITGVQFEVGSTATSFDYRPYGTEFALCQRYFCIFRPAASAAGPLCNGAVYSSAVTFGNIMYPTTMRTNATLGLSPASVLQVLSNGAGYNTTSTNLGGETTAQAVELQIQGSGFPSGNGAFVRVNAGASNFISFSAEL